MPTPRFRYADAAIFAAAAVMLTLDIFDCFAMPMFTFYLLSPLMMISPLIHVVYFLCHASR